MAIAKPPKAAQQFHTELVNFRDAVRHDHTIALSKLRLSAKHRNGLQHRIAQLIKELAEVQIKLGISN